MRVLLFLLSIVAGVFGFILLAAAKSAIHEIQAFMLFLIAAVTFSGAGIIDAFTTLKVDVAAIRELLKKREKPDV